MAMMRGLILSRKIAGVACYPMPEFGKPTGVLTGIDCCFVEFFLIGAVLQNRNLRMVEVKGGGLGADLWQLSEVVTRRRARRRPLQRATPTPRIVGVHLRVLAALPDVPEEHQCGAAEQEGTYGG